MPIYPVRAAVEAVRQFLFAPPSGTDGLAEALAAARTALSLTTADLPDIAASETYWDREAQARSFPYVAIEPLRVSGEDAPNGRMIDVTVQLSLTVLDANIAQGEQRLAAMAWVYLDVLQAMFLRRTPRGSQGWTLNNGGTGSAAGRVIRCAVEDQALGADVGLESPNVVALTTLRVRMQEDY